MMKKVFFKKSLQKKGLWSLLIVVTFLSTVFPVQAVEQSDIPITVEGDLVGQYDYIGAADSRTDQPAVMEISGELKNSEEPAFISEIQSTAQAILPASYDPRRVNPVMVTPVKNQIKNTCWTYAAAASLESYVLKHTGETVVYSENYHNYATAPDGFTSGTNPYAFNRILDGSGQPYYAMYNMVVWNGPVLDRQFPDSIVGRINRSLMDIPSDVHVQGFQFFHSASGEADRAVKVDGMKRAIYQNGAVTTGSFGDDFYSSVYCKNASLYRPNSVGGTSNHAVTLVGWDDNYAVSNFATKPPGPGAFIMKNSWGTGAGDGGYYYVSYYDRFISYNVAASVSDVQPVNRYSKMYMLSKMMGFSSKQMLNIPAADIPFHIANVFTRDSGETEYLDAVGVFIQARDTQYEVYVNPADSTLNSSSLILAGSGTADTAGYITVPIDRQILTGSKFAVAVKMKSNQAYPIIASDNTSGTGESYFSLGGLDSFADHGGTGHFIINAYINGGTPVPTEPPEPPEPDGAQDDADIAAAKALIENTSYLVSQTGVTDIGQAKAAVEAVLNDLNLNGVTAAVTDGTFTAAEAGTESNTAGINGSYTFTVHLSKGIGTPETTGEMMLTITAVPYRDSVFPLSIRAWKADGSLTYGTWMQTNLSTALAPCTWTGNSTSAMPALYTGTITIDDPGTYYFVLAGTARWSLDGTCKAIAIVADDRGGVTVQGYDITGTSLGTANSNGKISYHPNEVSTLVVSWGGIPAGNTEGTP